MRPIEGSASTNQRSCPTSVKCTYPATSLRVHMKVSLAKEKFSGAASNMEPTSVLSKGGYMSFHGNLGGVIVEIYHKLPESSCVAFGWQIITFLIARGLLANPYTP